MRLRPARRLVGVVVAAALIYVFAVNSLLVWLYMVAAMLLALIPVGCLGPIAAARPVTLRALAPRSRGFDAPLPEDRGKLFAFSTLELALSGDVDLDRVQLGPLILADGRRVEAFAEAGEHGPVLRADLGRRGAVDVAAIELTSSWPFGLVEARRTVPLPVSLLVHPRYQVVTPERGAGGGIGGEDAQRKGSGEDVVGLREYRPGDSRRQIHWMTTARAGKLMVVERAAPTVAALNLSLRLDPRADHDAVELAVHITASVAASCVQAGRPFRLSLPDGPPEARRWNETLARLARTEPAAQPPPAGVSSAAVRAEADVVIVESPAGVVRLPARAGAESVAAALENLL
jgi:uncharacterized protein (DUF58 family)